MKTKKSQIKFKNLKFGSEYYKGKNEHFDLIFNSVRNICVGENPKSILDVGCGGGITLNFLKMPIILGLILVMKY